MIRSVLEQNPRPFSELLFHCEFRAIASRVVSAVSNFFKQIAHLILEKYCQLENRIVAISNREKNFIDHLLKIPMDQREAFVRQVFSLLSPKVDPDLQDTFIRAMAKKDGHRLVRSIRQHITFDMTTSLNIKIIEIITEVPFRDRELFIDHLLKLIPQEMGCYEKEKIIDAIAEIPTSERQQLIKNASLFISDRMWTEDKIVVIKNLKAVPEDQRDLLIHLALQVLSQETDRHFLDPVFESITTIPPNEREQVIEKAVLLFTTKMSRSNRLTLIETLTNIPSDQRELVVDLALQVITQTMNYYSRKKIIEAIVAVSPDERESVIKNTLLLITPEMKSFNRCRMIELVAAQPANNRDNFVANRRRGIHHQNAVSSTYQRVNAHEGNRDQQTREIIEPPRNHQDERDLSQEEIQSIRDKFIAYLRDRKINIPADERERVIQGGLLVAGAKMSADRKIALIQFLLGVPKHEREFVVDLALKLITEEMNFHGKRDILQSISNIPADEREQVILSSLSLIAGSSMNGTDRSLLIGLVYEIPSFLRGDTVNLASNLITQEMDLIDRGDILRSISDIPIEYRSQVILDNLDTIKSQSNVTEQLYTIRDLLDKAFLESDLKRGPYQGAHNRDQQTRKAIELLREYQKKKDGEDLSKEEIDTAVKKFTTYLRDCEIKPIEKAKARNALSGTQMTRNDNFGPLINKLGFKISGLQVSGKTLVARLWVFTSGLEERERENARVGMVAALSRSYDQFGGRVCNPRKAQELVLSVLQGRLDGVNVEGEMIPEQMTKEQAIRVFFDKKANQEICNKEELLEAADKFCKETPSVNREEFIQEINEYAKEQGMF